MRALYRLSLIRQNLSPPVSSVSACARHEDQRLGLGLGVGIMRGEVLHYDEDQGFGFITGADGNRYTFSARGPEAELPVSKGTLVEFKESGGQARDIFRSGELPLPRLRHAFGHGSDVRNAAAPAPRRSISDACRPSASPVEQGLGAISGQASPSNYANFRGRARRKEYWGFTCSAISR